MKRIRRALLMFSLFMLLVLYGFICLSKRNEYQQRDIVYYNDKLKLIEEAYINGMSEKNIERNYNCRIVLSKELIDPELTDLYRKNAFVVDFAPNGEYIGKVAWLQDYNSFNHVRETFLYDAIMLWAFIFIGVICLLIHEYMAVVKPIKELVDFSQQIAKGNLDEALPIHKDNLFGSFVEGFDIMREELKAARKREIESEIARKELITQLSHDIKTPLAVISATCEVLDLKLRRRMNQKKIDEPEKNDLEDAIGKVEVISRKADTVSALMSNVMHATLDELEHIEVDVREENSSVVEKLIQNVTGYGNIVIQQHIPPCLIYVDKLRMEQVIDNVISNSFKYAGTDINVMFAETEDVIMADGSRGRFIKIIIKDNGPGVDEDELALIAEKYYRGSNSSGQNGYGLGLYLVRLYMEKQGGGMEYYNDNGFVVELLLRKV